MSVQPLGDEDPKPEPGPPPEKGTKVGDCWEQWLGAAPAVHPDTDPEAIAASQRGDVADARRRLGPGATVEQIGDDVILPVWVVRRRLQELAEL